MSHYALCRTTIRNPDRQLLKQVLDRIAQQLGGELVENAVVEGWSFEKRVDFLVKMPLDYGNGYGIEITDNGEVVVHVDDHGAPMTGQQFQELLQREYTAEAVKAVMEEMGYSVEEDRDEEAITIKALGW